MKTILLAVLVVIILLVAARLSVYAVDATEFVYVTRFGEHIATYDGGNAETDAGLHVGLPWPLQSAMRLDRRLQFLDLPSVELVTHDPVTKEQQDRLLVEGYVCWRIAGKDKVDLFVRRLGTLDNAKINIGQRISSQLGGLIQQLSTKDLLNTKPGVVETTMKNVREQLTARIGPVLRDELGVELVDVRVRRFSYHPDVQQDIFARIRSERNKLAEQYRAEGLREAAKIRNDADKEARIIEAKARQKEKLIKGAAEVEAARIRNQAHSVDPEFYVFLKKLDSLKSILGANKSVLLLSSHRRVFEMLFEPPQGAAVSRPGQDVSAKNGKKNDK